MPLVARMCTSDVFISTVGLVSLEGIYNNYSYGNYVVIPFILDVRVVDAPAGVTQKEAHTGFLYLPSAVPA